MNQPLRDRLAESWNALPPPMRYPPAEEKAVQQFEESFGPIPEPFRWFLLKCGGGVIGSEWIDGIEQLPQSHRKFQREQGPGGWRMSEAFVIGWDGAGNPIAIDRASGTVVSEDHNFSGAHVLASSFEQFIENGLRANEA